jgi:hypothetical protein
MEAPVPTQAAALLKGRIFPSFGEFRSEFWKAVASIPELANQFSVQNRALMAGGNAPKALRSQRLPGRKEFILHHEIPISKGGAVYDLDNIKIVSPRRHFEIHYGD